MSGKENLRLKWLYSGCHQSPAFLSKNKFCFPCDNFICICDIDTGSNSSFSSPGNGISCMATLPEFGVIGIAEKCKFPKILIFKYPSHRMLTSICYGSQSPYVALTFAGVDYLVSVCGKPDNDLTLWNWRKGEKMYSTLQTLTYLSDCTYKLTVNPSAWYQLCLQQTMSLTVLEIKESGGNFIVEQSCLVSQEKEEKSDFCIQKKCGSSVTSIFDSTEKSQMRKRGTIVAHCWIPDGKIAMACEDGSIMIVDVLDFAIDVLHCFKSNEVTSLAYSIKGLFLANNGGHISCVDIGQNKWRIVENFDVGQNIKELAFSPNYDILTIISNDGSVSVYSSSEKKMYSKIRSILCDKTAVVGISIVYPDSRYCIIAMSNGVLQCLCIVTGKFVSETRIDENVIGLTTNSLCSVIVISTTNGFLYFLDASDINSLRIVHFDKFHSVPVEHVEFDDYAKFIMLATGSEKVTVLNGLPSSKFKFLGCRNPIGHVQDVKLFTRSEEEQTVALILTKSSRCLQQGVADVLEVLDFPIDLLNNSEKHRIDIFGTLSEDSLNSRTFDLKYPATLVEMHTTLGALIYSPLIGDIQCFNVSQTIDDFRSRRETNFVLAENLSDICDVILSPDKKQLICSNRYAIISIYDLSDTTKAPIVSKPFTSEPCAFKIEYSHYDDSVLVASRNGIVVCCEMLSQLSDVRVPQWNLKFSTLSHSETEFLRNMENTFAENTKTDEKYKDFSSFMNPALLRAELGRNCKLIDMSLEYLISQASKAVTCDYTLESNSNLEQDIFFKHCLENNDRLKRIDTKQIVEHSHYAANEEQSLVGIKQDILVTKYVIPAGVAKRSFEVPLSSSKELKPDDISTNQLLGELKALYVPESVFGSPDEFATSSTKLEQVTRLREMAFTIMRFFNWSVDRVTTFKTSALRKINNYYSKIEKIRSSGIIDDPFWVVETRTDELSVLESLGIYGDSAGDASQCEVLNETELERKPDFPQFMEEKHQRDWTIEEREMATKYVSKCNAIEKSNARKELDYMNEKVHELIDNVDGTCDQMIQFKSVCITMICDIETKVYMLLLWEILNQELSNWLLFYQANKAATKSCREHLHSVAETMTEIRHKAKTFLHTLVITERQTDNEARQKCRKIQSDSEQLYKCYKQRPPLSSIFTFDKHNPYRPLAGELSHFEPGVHLKDLNSVKNCPRGVDAKCWTIICDTRSWKFAAEEVLRSETIRFLDFENVLLQWKMQDCNLKQELKSIDFVVQKLTSLAAKLADTLNDLLVNKTINSESSVLFEELHPVKEDDKVPTVSTIMEVVNKEALRNRQLWSSLEFIECKCDALCNLRETVEPEKIVTGDQYFESRIKKLDTDLKVLQQTIRPNSIEELVKQAHSLLQSHSH